MVRHLSVVLLAVIVLVASTHVLGLPDKEKEGDPTAGATYVGAKDCKKCHFKQHRTWTKMKHAKAWDVLQPKLEKPDQKDSEGRLCISCHVTGHGAADRGGFVDAKASAHLLGVQCEACHGPGSKHIEAAKKLKEAGEKKFPEGASTFQVLRTSNCADCHNPHKAHAKMD